MNAGIPTNHIITGKNEYEITNKIVDKETHIAIMNFLSIGQSFCFQHLKI